MRDRDKCIAIIEGTFPADADTCSTQIIGMQLLDRAKRETEDWRALPDGVLSRYAELCIEQQQRQRRHADRNRHYYSHGTHASHSANAIEQSDDTFPGKQGETS